MNGHWSGQESQAYRFADDLYHQQLVKAYGGKTQKGTNVSVGINVYIERFEADDQSLAIRYRILLLKRVLTHSGNQTFEGLTTALISKLTDDLRKATKKGVMKGDYSDSTPLSGRPDDHSLWAA